MRTFAAHCASSDPELEITDPSAWTQLVGCSLAFMVPFGRNMTRTVVDPDIIVEPVDGATD